MRLGIAYEKMATASTKRVSKPDVVERKCFISHAADTAITAPMAAP